MSRTIELIGSAKGKSSFDLSSQITYTYRVTGVTTDAEAVLAVDSAAPLSVVEPCNLLELFRDDFEWEQEGPDIWRVNVVFVDPKRQEQNLETGEFRVTFTTQGGTAHITTSLETLNRYTTPAWPFAPWHAQSIGVNDNGEVQGCDIVIPVLKFSITYRQPRATITDAYVRLIEEMTGTTNGATWKGRAAGEVLFMGADGSQGNKSDPEITYHFARQKNLTGLIIGAITGIAKPGWAYLWTEFEDVADGDADRLVKRPRAVHVERVYNPSTFSALGIG
jgi:hypothetical protein